MTDVDGDGGDGDDDDDDDDDDNKNNDNDSHPDADDDLTLHWKQNENRLFAGWETRRLTGRDDEVWFGLSAL